MAIEAKRLSALLSVGFLTGLPPSHAVSPALGHELPCIERAAFAALLVQRHREQRRAFGPAGGGGLVELWASAGGATWTLLVTTPGGVSCLVAEGRGWRANKRRDNKRRGAAEPRPGKNTDSGPAT